MLIENNLKYCRENLEMTQEEMGYVLGVTKGTVANWENGNDSIPLRQLVKISNQYNVSIDFLLGLTRDNEQYCKIPKLDKVIIGKRIKLLREKLNYTQTQFAKQCSIGQSTLSLYESGKRLVNTLTLQTICKKFNASADQILGRKKNSN